MDGTTIREAGPHLAAWIDRAMTLLMTGIARPQGVHPPLLLMATLPRDDQGRRSPAA